MKQAIGHDYYIFYKPFGVISQFTPEVSGQACLKDWLNLKSDVYPVGRLDLDSEGLLLLSNDKALQRAVLLPENKMIKTYWLQVEGHFGQIAAHQLMEGVYISVQKKRHLVKAINVHWTDHPVSVSDRNPPIRYRKSIPDTWIQISISEGKNRQLRKMLAAVNFPVLRLIRVAIGCLTIHKMKPGEYRKLSNNEYSILFKPPKDEGFLKLEV